MVISLQPGDSSNRRFNPQLGLFEPIHENATVYPDSFEVLSSSPRILHFPKFISDEECDAFIDFGKARMSLSKKNLIRNRFVAHLPHDEMLANATLRRVLNRIARQTKQPVDTFQVKARSNSPGTSYSKPALGSLVHHICGPLDHELFCDICCRSLNCSSTMKTHLMFRLSIFHITMTKAGRRAIRC